MTTILWEPRRRSPDRNRRMVDRMLSHLARRASTGHNALAGTFVLLERGLPVLRRSVTYTDVLTERVQRFTAAGNRVVGPPSSTGRFETRRIGVWLFTLPD